MSKHHVSDVNVDVVPRAIASEIIRRKSASLRPGAAMIEAAARNQPEAVAIRDAWRFNHPVTVVSREKFAAMVERSQVVFHG